LRFVELGILERSEPEQSVSEPSVDGLKPTISGQAKPTISGGRDS
jgi:hypothetical protein